MTMLNKEFTIKQMKFRNRLVMPAITTNYGSKEGFVTDDTLKFYKERSKDIGLVIVEATSVHAGGSIVPNGIGLWDDSQIPGMERLVKTIKERGALAVVQLNHAGPRCSPKGIQRQGISPSGVAFRPDIDPVIMNVNDIEQLINDFGKAAQRALKAGFDGVEIHGAHFYLVSQFLSPLTNQRNDDYGGDAKGRATLALKIVKKLRNNLGQEYPIFFRINAIENVEGGQNLEDAVIIGKLLAREGVDVFDVSLIHYGAWKKINDKTCLVGSSALAKDKPSGANIDITSRFRKQVARPVIVVGKFGKGSAAESAVKKEQIEMVAIARQMICDPESAKKILNGDDDKIIACDECLKCFATIGKGAALGCKVNKNLPL